MKVTLLNPDIVKDLFYWWGMTSKVCYNTKTNKPENIGKHCMSTRHFSGSRSQYFLFQVDNCPRFTIDQAVRHEVGAMKNVASFRYISKSTFNYSAPEEIFDNQELFNRYNEHMDNTMELYSDIQNYVYKKTGSHERANESSRYLLPLATESNFVFGLTLEGLIHFCNMRLCVRAEDKIRELATLMKKEVLQVLPELKDKLVPNCQAMLYCPEGNNSCSAYPQKKDLLKIIEANNVNVST